MKTRYLVPCAAAFAFNVHAQFLNQQIIHDAAGCASGGPCAVLEQEAQERARQDAFWARQRATREQQERNDREAAARVATTPAAHSAQPSPSSANRAGAKHVSSMTRKQTKKPPQ